MKKSFLTLITVALVASVIFFFRHIQKPHSPTVCDTIIVGTSADFQPMSFIKDGTIVGFDIDVITEIGKRLGKPITIKNMPFELLIPQLQIGHIHIIAAGMSATPERANRVYFTPAYLSGDPLVVVRMANSAPITSLKDLAHKEVIVNQGYTSDLYMSKIPDISIKRLGTVADALMALKMGRGDAFVTAANTMAPVLEQQGTGTYTIFPIPETNENVSLAISKDYPELASQVTAKLTEMEEDGTLAALKEKWHVQ